MSASKRAVGAQIGVIVGSNRRMSINRQLAVALIGLAGDRVRAFDIRIDDLPMYNADLDPKAQPSVVRFTEEVAKCTGVLIVMPEHNRSLPAVLKNAIDWGSKPMEANVWRDKAVAITGTTPGAIATAVGQQHLRQIMGILGSLVMGGEAYVQFKPGFIGSDGQIADASSRSFLQAYVDRFVSLVELVAGHSSTA